MLGWVCCGARIAVIILVRCKSKSGFETLAVLISKVQARTRGDQRSTLSAGSCNLNSASHPLTNSEFATHTATLVNSWMCGRVLCAMSPGRLNHPPTLSRGLRYLTIRSSAVNNSVGIRRKRVSYGYPSTSFPSIPMATRMLQSNKATNGKKHQLVDEDGHSSSTTTHNHPPDHDHDHQGHGHSHNHSHSHGIFSAFGHTHSREDASTAGAEKIVEALKGGSALCQCSMTVPDADMTLFSAVDRGTQITLVGLYSNVVLTGTKGIAGWYMVCLLTICACACSNLVSCQNSAALLAEAGHSLSGERRFIC